MIVLEVKLKCKVNKVVKDVVLVLWDLHFATQCEARVTHGWAVHTAEMCWPKDRVVCSRAQCAMSILLPQ